MNRDDDRAMLMEALARPRAAAAPEAAHECPAAPAGRTGAAIPVAGKPNGPQRTRQRAIRGVHYVK